MKLIHLGTIDAKKRVAFKNILEILYNLAKDHEIERLNMRFTRDGLYMFVVGQDPTNMMYAFLAQDFFAQYNEANLTEDILMSVRAGQLYYILKAPHNEDSIIKIGMIQEDENDMEVEEDQVYAGSSEMFSCIFVDKIQGKVSSYELALLHYEDMKIEKRLETLHAIELDSETVFAPKKGTLRFLFQDMKNIDFERKPLFFQFKMDPNRKLVQINSARNDPEDAKAQTVIRQTADNQEHFVLITGEQTDGVYNYDLLKKVYPMDNIVAALQLSQNQEHENNENLLKMNFFALDTSEKSFLDIYFIPFTKDEGD